MNLRKIIFFDIDQTILYSNGMMGSMTVTPFHVLTGWKSIPMSHRGVTLDVAVKVNKSVIRLMQKFRNDSTDLGIMTAGGEEYQKQLLNKLSVEIPEKFVAYEHFHQGSDTAVNRPCILIDDSNITNSDLLKKLCFICGIQWEQFISLCPSKGLKIATMMAKRHLVVLKPYTGRLFSSVSPKHLVHTIEKKFSDLAKNSNVNFDLLMRADTEDFMGVNKEKAISGFDWYHLLDAPKKQKRYSRKILSGLKDDLREACCL